MYVKNGIAYAGEETPTVKVISVRALSDYRLWLRFNNGEVRVFDFRPLLKEPAFVPLNDAERFADVYVDYGVPVWMDGDIDIDPCFLWENSVQYTHDISA